MLLPLPTQDFAALQLTDINNSIEVRRDRIFLLMEEIRRLRIQQRLKGGREVTAAERLADEEYVSALPFLPPLNQRTLRDYYVFYGSFGEQI
jgi:hypothetical protein